MSSEQKRQLRTVGRRSPRTLRKARKNAQREEYVAVTKTGMGTLWSDMAKVHDERVKQYTAPQRFLSATRTRKTGGGRRRRSSRRRRRSCGCGK